MDDDSLALVETIVKAADGRKADDIVALNVAGITTMTRYLVIVSGNSRPQNQAIANAVRIQVEEVFDGMRPGATGVPEGSADSGWMVLDYGSVMLHIMTPKSRLYYNVQGQWTAKGGVPVDVSGYLVPNAPPAAAVTDNAADNAASAEQDPFWS
jgi:ribosome-associated protein